MSPSSALAAAISVWTGGSPLSVCEPEWFRERGMGSGSFGIFRGSLLRCLKSVPRAKQSSWLGGGQHSGSFGKYVGPKVWLNKLASPQCALKVFVSCNSAKYSGRHRAGAGDPQRWPEQMSIA